MPSSLTPKQTKEIELALLGAYIGETAHFVANWADEFGNTHFAGLDGNAQVILATVERGYLGYAQLRVLEPAHMAERWPTPPANFYMKCDGPVRTLTREEHRRLLDDPKRDALRESLRQKYLPGEEE
jgi:hypothetical protein